jgi:hypothetical protein
MTKYDDYVVIQRQITSITNSIKSIRDGINESTSFSVSDTLASGTAATFITITIENGATSVEKEVVIPESTVPTQSFRSHLAAQLGLQGTPDVILSLRIPNYVSGQGEVNIDFSSPGNFDPRARVYPIFGCSLQLEENTHYAYDKDMLRKQNEELGNQRDFLQSLRDAEEELADQFPIFRCMSSADADENATANTTAFLLFYRNFSALASAAADAATDADDSEDDSEDENEDEDEEDTENDDE